MLYLGSVSMKALIPFLGSDGTLLEIIYRTWGQRSEAERSALANIGRHYQPVVFIPFGFC